MGSEGFCPTTNVGLLDVGRLAGRHELVNYEAEDLPLDVLQDLMGILVSKGAY